MIPVSMPSNARFPLGTVVSTPGALNALGNTPQECGEAATRLLSRHASGDWGEVCAEDARSNEQALREGYRLMSVYTHLGQVLWIITEADRSVTTFLLPEEY